MNDKHTKLSKLLSLVLRHQPEVIGLNLDANGWANTDELLKKLNQNGHEVDLTLLNEVVASNNKQRFSFSPDGTKIRANQGHSIDIQLNLQPQTPPEVLYHGTAERFVSSILETGLDKRSRQHVHLSANLETALEVGRRHGKPYVFEVRAMDMHDAGYLFFQSENGVWLTDHVPVAFLGKGR